MGRQKLKGALFLLMRLIKVFNSFLLLLKVQQRLSKVIIPKAFLINSISSSSTSTRFNSLPYRELAIRLDRG